MNCVLTGHSAVLLLIAFLPYCLTFDVLSSVGRRSFLDTSNSFLISSVLQEEQKSLQQYNDFTRLPSGVQIRDVSPGKAAEGGVAAKPGDRVVFQWSGYTIGYFGR